MTDLQSLQQKPESTNDAHSDLGRGLEGFMCSGHLDDCLSFGSCSSVRTHDDEDDGGDQSVRTSRRSDLVDGDDLAESSAAARRQHILGTWAARQAQEMITTIERTNRESELMALAGLHAVSMLDSSFLRESQLPNSHRQGNVEQTSTRASAILQMWRELEDEQLINRARERLRHQRHVESNLNASNIGNGRGSENQGSSRSRMEFQDEQGDSNGSSREQSPDFGDIDRAPVRHIVRAWMDTAISDHPRNVSQRNTGTQRELLGARERERVRIVREWMQMTTQQRGGRGGQTPQRENEIQGGQANLVHEDANPNHDDNQPENIRRGGLRIRGRQAVVDLLVRIERERHMELQNLVEHRAVSHFAYRNRLQVSCRHVHAVFINFKFILVIMSYLFP